MIIRFILFSVLFCGNVLSVSVTEVHVLSGSGRNDYVIEGENAQISCHYVLRKSDERIVSVLWEKDGKDVYFSAPNKRPIAIGVLSGHVDLYTLTSADLLHTIFILNVTMEMHGTYTCHVSSDLNSSQNEAFMTVIVDACRENDWRTHTDMVACTEEISFHCTGMFPKPSPICSIYDDRTGLYIAAESFDRNVQLENGTFEISIQRRYDVRDWFNYTGHISFRCHAVVLMTTWRTGLVYKLFGDSGCNDPPPPLANGDFGVTGDVTCWRTPREGSNANYWCHDGFDISGPSVLQCRNGSWVPSSDPRTFIVSQRITDLPFCNHSLIIVSLSPLFTLIMILISVKSHLRTEIQ